MGRHTPQESAGTWISVEVDYVTEAEGDRTERPGVTVERAASLIRSIPEYVPRRSAVRIVTNTLKVASTEVEDLADSCDARDRELRQRIDHSHHRIEKLERDAQEAIRSLQEQIDRATKFRDVRVRREQETIEKGETEVADLKRLRSFLFSTGDETVPEASSFQHPGADETGLPERDPVEAGEQVEAGDLQEASSAGTLGDSRFEAAARIFRSRYLSHTAILLSTLLSAGALAYTTYVTFGPQPQLTSESEQNGAADTGSGNSSPENPQSAQSASGTPDSARPSAPPLSRETGSKVASIFARHPAPSLAAPGEALGYGGRIALTFDDGPDPRITPAILDTLRKHDIEATFFVSGERAAQHPHLIRRIVREGHALGNHTYNHPNMGLLSPRTARGELRRTQRAVNRALGYRYEMVVMRPPYGEPYISQQGLLPRFRAIVYGQALVPVLWNIDSRDWELAGRPGAIVNTVVRNTGAGGGIVLMHDTRESTAKALPRIIRRYEKRQLSFESVTEMLTDKYETVPD